MGETVGETVGVTMGVCERLVAAVRLKADRWERSKGWSKCKLWSDFWGFHSLSDTPKFLLAIFLTGSSPLFLLES